MVSIKNLLPTTSLGAWMRSRQALFAIVVLMTLGVYAAEGQARRKLIPTPATHSDQGAYLKYAREMHESNYQIIGGRNRMPVFPFLLSWIYRDGMMEPDFLARAQAFSVNLSVLVLGLLYLIWRRFFPALFSLALLMVTAFAVFLFRAVLVQTEVLFYFLFFCGFILLWRILAAPHWWLALLGGAVMGVAHLTKASVLPALLLFVVLSAARAGWELRSRAGNSARAALIRLSQLSLVVAAFLAVVFPYIQTSKRIFGHYFYNVNSTFYIWCDSWPEAEALTKMHGDRSGWPDLPPEQIPSAKKYWRDHTVRQIASRLLYGVRIIVIKNTKFQGYAKYIALLLITTVGLIAERWRRFRETIREQPFVVLFVAGFFAGYLLLFAWYEPIVSDSRFVLSLFLPFVFVFAKLILRLGRDVTISLRGVRVPLVPAFAILLLVLAGTDAAYNASQLRSAQRTQAAAPAAAVSHRPRLA